jgi:hypothetical protein
MTGFVRRAEGVLDIASAAGASPNSAIIFDRQGGMRMLDPSGWSLDGLISEFGAQEVYRISRRGGAVRVEAWSESERCVIERKTAALRQAPRMLTITAGSGC